MAFLPLLLVLVGCIFLLVEPVKLLLTRLRRGKTLVKPDYPHTEQITTLELVPAPVLVAKAPPAPTAPPAPVVVPPAPPAPQRFIIHNKKPVIPPAPLVPAPVVKLPARSFCTPCAPVYYFSPVVPRKPVAVPELESPYKPRPISNLARLRSLAGKKAGAQPDKDYNLAAAAFLADLPADSDFQDFVANTKDEPVGFRSASVSNYLTALEPDNDKPTS